MFYGYIEDARGLSDIITGLIQGRTGTLELFVNRYFLSLKVEEGLIVEFQCDLGEFEENSSNPYNILIYCVASMLEKAEGFFAFYEDIKLEGLKLREKVGSEEVMIQATIVRKDLDDIMEKVISPYAIFKVLRRSKETEFFEGKNIIEIIAYSQEPIVNLVRRIKDSILEGSLDIYEFREERIHEEPEIEYVMEGVPLRKLNVVAVLEGVKARKQSGMVKISSPTYTVNLFFSEGEIFAVHPVNFDIFDFLISPDPNAEISLIGMDRSVVKFLASRYLTEPDIRAVSSNFMEISKLFLGLSKYRRDALLLISEKRGDRFIIFRGGKVIASLIEEGGILKHTRGLKFEEPFFVSLYFPKRTENIKAVIYVFMINEILSILMKHSPSKMVSSVLREAIKIPFLSFEESKFVLIRDINEEEEEQLLNFLSFILDLCVQEVGKERQEEDLEFQLRPFRDIFRVLEVEKFLKPQENV